MRKVKIALLGNPNAGKSTIFNELTGLNQKIGNFPGVTVDKKTGFALLSDKFEAEITDLPGLYSLYPTSKDERIVVRYLADPAFTNEIDVLLYVMDITQIEKHFLLLTQIMDLQIPLVVALNMTDIADENKWKIDAEYLEKKIGVPVVRISGRTKNGIDELKSSIIGTLASEQSQNQGREAFYNFSKKELSVVESIKKDHSILSDYQALLWAHHHDWLFEDSDLHNKEEVSTFKPLRHQIEETMARYDRFVPIAKKTITSNQQFKELTLTDRLDKYLTHRIIGPIIFFALMLLIFQSIFTWATPLMDGIESIFGWLGQVSRNNLPAGWATDLFVDGVLAGIGGVVVFVPQIAILFLFIGFLEQVGYMARAVSLFDNSMQRFGLNGRSIVALVSGGACAIPAIMSTRTITNWKERLITIIVTPFISCAARIPVYAILIAFVVPSESVLGIFNMQGLLLMGLYLLGILAALISAYILKRILKSNERSFLLMELPIYQWPSLKSLWLIVYEKTKTFVVEAGKVIFIISILLWFLASFGPGQSLDQAAENAEVKAKEMALDESQTADLVASFQLESSYAGRLGKAIEPVIAPLGYDWKIGIALITSFAAREVFVGTMATIYAIGSTDEEATIREQMSREKHHRSGLPVYSFATSLSLLIFYVFAMQCMSTLAVVRRETKSWKWPIIQFIFMTALAYLSALLVYQVCS